MSIHLDVLDGVRGEKDDDDALSEQAIGGRAANSSVTIERRDSAEPFRLSSIDQALEKAERVRRLATRPMSLVEGRERRVSNPLMVPLPESPASTGARPFSVMSWNMSSPGRRLEDEEEILDTPNPFALPAPPPELGSRFDPKVLEAQRRDSFSSSSDVEIRSRPTSRLSLAPTFDRPVQPEAPSRPQSRVFDDIPTSDQFGRPLMPQRYSTSFRPMDRRSLLRPKSLIMPARLSGTHPASLPPKNVPDGFVLGEKPLPPGSRTSILSLGGRPGLPLSLSQKTFRSSLLVDGRREEEEYFVGEAGGEGEEGVHLGQQAEEAVEKRPGKLYVCKVAVHVVGC